MKIQLAQDKPTLPITSHLITNLEHKLKPPHKRNQYHKEFLNACADVNIMSGSVYKLSFQDPDLKKIAPSKFEIGTYTNDTVKLVGPCTFYLVHPDTK